MFITRVAVVLLCVVAAGFGAVAVILTPGAPFAALLLGALAGVTGFAVAVGTLNPPPDQQHDEQQDQQQDRRRAWVTARAAATVVAGATLVVIGMIAVFGAATAPLLLAVVIIAGPWGWPRVRRHLHRHRADPHQADSHRADRYPAGSRDTARSNVWAAVEPTPATKPAVPARAVASLSTSALCARWQHSYHALAHTRGRADLEGLVGLRRRCLDELERRDPDAVARWLATDPRPAAISPRRHLTSPDTPTPPPPATPPQ